ncbi:MAG: hypothetical protein IT427_01895 [Pirellulales bacterium]|nr:hypothetical protein [Pirellulales bacterium]
MSLLLKALSPKQPSSPIRRSSPLLRNDEVRPAAETVEALGLDNVVTDSETPCGESMNARALLDPAEYITDATAIIEPFEPFAQVATEYLPSDAHPEFDEIASEPCAIPATIDSTATATDESNSTCEQSANGAPAVAADDVATSAIARLEELQRLIFRDSETAEKRAILSPEHAELPTPFEPKLHPTLPLREEYCELRDHLLKRFPLDKQTTLLVIDAGRTTLDASWLIPLAASIIPHISSSTNRWPKVLIVEGAGPDCSVARGLGLQCSAGMSAALADPASALTAIVPTEHPAIQLLTGSNAKLGHDDREPLAKLWPELRRRFDLILVAAGPLNSTVVHSRHSMPAADFYLPFADGIILSVEIDGTPRKVAQAMCRRLADGGAKLIGCVVHGDAA